jgi:hypothetical protein
LIIWWLLGAGVVVIPAVAVAAQVVIKQALYP